MLLLSPNSGWYGGLSHRKVIKASARPLPFSRYMRKMKPHAESYFYFTTFTRSP